MELYLHVPIQCGRHKVFRITGCYESYWLITIVTTHNQLPDVTSLYFILICVRGCNAKFYNKYTLSCTGVYRVLVGKPEGKRPLGKPRLKWEDNIKMDLRDVGCGGMDWIGLVKDRDRKRAVVNAVMNFRVP